MSAFEVSDWFVCDPTDWKRVIPESRNEPRQITRMDPDLFGDCQALFYVGEDGDEYVCADSIAWKVVPVGPPEFRFTKMADPYSLMVNGSFSIHDFANDPDTDPEASYKWGAYVAARGEWLVNYETKEDAARGGWDAIMEAAKR